MRPQRETLVGSQSITLSGGRKILIRYRKDMFEPHTIYTWWILSRLPRVLKLVPRAGSALDLATGTGVIAVALSLHGLRRVVCSDSDPRCAQWVKTNALLNKVRISFRESHLLGNIIGRFDLVTVSGPQSPVLEHDMQRYAGPEGVEFLEQVLVHAKNHLAPRGSILFTTSSLANIPRLRKALRRMHYRVMRVFRFPLKVPISRREADFYEHLLALRRGGKASFDIVQGVPCFQPMLFLVQLE